MLALYMYNLIVILIHNYTINMHINAITDLPITILSIETLNIVRYYRIIYIYIYIYMMDDVVNMCKICTT